MASFNKVILIGNLVADPELKQTQSGIAVTSFSIAVSRKFNRDNSQQQTDFFNIVCWRSTAEFVTKYFSKGKSILICGSLQTRTWTDQQGQKRYITEVVADEVSFVERKSDNAGAGVPPMMSAEPAPYSNASKDTDFEEMATDEDLPF
ncbi:MAG: single-stranded DNA-binding protein [Clostridia bacterium]|nr:single-stranded DNA-binding protein [Clostridia bacterium]